MTFIPKEVYGIIGFPLGHSMSPLLHNTAFQALGIPAAFLSWSLAPEQLPAFVQAMPMLNIKGASVTIPHKAGILPLLDQQTDRVRALGACNLLYIEDGKLCGDNTDILGFMAPLEQLALPSDARVLLLGGGGAARAVVVGLQTLGFTNITVADIAEHLADDLCASFGISKAAWDDRAALDADLIINATPLGMTGKFFGQSPLDATYFKERPKGVVYDVIYTPMRTRLQELAQQGGWATISGQSMFIGQGDHAFRRWTGQPLPEAAIVAVQKALSAMETAATRA